MSKLEIVGRILLGITLLVFVALVKVWFRGPTKQQQEMEQQAAKMRKIMDQVIASSKNYPGNKIDLESLNSAMDYKIAAKTRSFIDEVYSGLLEATKKGISVKSYFMDQNKAGQLKAILEQYKLVVNRKLPGRENFKKGSILELNYVKDKGEIFTWEMFYFGKCNKKAAIKNLKKIKEEFEWMEIELIKERNRKPVK